jgi:hypothetical protein
MEDGAGTAASVARRRVVFVGSSDCLQVARDFRTRRACRPTVSWRPQCNLGMTLPAVRSGERRQDLGRPPLSEQAGRESSSTTHAKEMHDEEGTRDKGERSNLTDQPPNPPTRRRSQTRELILRLPSGLTPQIDPNSSRRDVRLVVLF